MATETVLVVNDEPDILTVVADRLAFYGLQVRTARDGPECLAQVDQAVPDLVLLDVRMPAMDGMEVLDQLRRRHPALPVLMVTASANGDVVEESLSRGAVDCLLKPFEPDQLRDKVFGILRKDIL